MFPYLIVRENIHDVDETAALSPTLTHRPIVIYRQHLIEGQRPTYTWWYRTLWYDGLGWRQISGRCSASFVPLLPKSMWPLSPHQYCASVYWFLQNVLCVCKKPHQNHIMMTLSAPKHHSPPPGTQTDLNLALRNNFFKHLNELYAHIHACLAVRMGITWAFAVSDLFALDPVDLIYLSPVFAILSGVVRADQNVHHYVQTVFTTSSTSASLANM